MQTIKLYEGAKTFKPNKMLFVLHGSVTGGHTYGIRAGLCKERDPPHNDFMRNDGVAVDITFLRHPLLTKVFRGCP